MVLLAVGYVVFAVAGIAIFIYTRDVDDYDEEYYSEAPVENLIGDAYTYTFVESDYIRVEKELMKFADELALGKKIA